MRLTQTEKSLLLLALALVGWGRFKAANAPPFYWGAAAAAAALIPAAMRANQPLPVEQKAEAMHGPEFLKATRQMEKELGMPQGTATSIFWSESGLNPQAREPNYGGGGLIGFMPSTVGRDYGITHAQLLSLPAIEQLPYVKYFYQKWLSRGVKPSSAEEWYLLTFYPAAVGKGKAHVIAQRGSAVYQGNAALDYNKDGILTVGDFYSYIQNKPRLAGTIFQPNKDLPA